MFDYTKDTGQIGVNDEPLVPHPDGKAWPKCCRSMIMPDTDKTVDCAFVRNQEGGARLSVSNPHRSYGGCGIGKAILAEVPFMCAHRSTDDGYHRVCAGWDACFGNKTRNNP